MANTRQSAKRARQADKRQERNKIQRTATKTVLAKAVAAVKAGDVAQAKAAYLDAVKALSKAASKGAIPKRRAARKVSRLTRMAQKALPQLAK